MIPATSQQLQVAHFMSRFGGTSSLTGKVIDSTATGCVVELVPEGKPSESCARRIFFPWAAIRSIELLEESHQQHRSPVVAQPFKLPEYPGT